MKQVILAILIVIAAQPLQASVCAMDMGQDMQHAMDVGGSDPDCCDHDQPESSDCEPLMHCGAAPAGVAVLDAGIVFRAVPLIGQLPLFRTGPLSPSFDAPLYRPPIS